MTIVGTPSENQARIYRGVWGGQERMIERMRPWARAGAIVEAFGEECRRHGLLFSGCGLLAHGLGQAVHDYPVIQDARDPSILEEGVVLTIEPYVVTGSKSTSWKTMSW